MNQAEVDCLAANTYIELALHADNKSRRRHYAAKGEVHLLRARQNRNQGYVRSVFEVRLAQREPAESALGRHARHPDLTRISCSCANFVMGHGE
jgi:hypothetical protein